MSDSHSEVPQKFLTLKTRDLSRSWIFGLSSNPRDFFVTIKLLNIPLQQTKNIEY